MAKLYEVQAELSHVLAEIRALDDPRPLERKPLKEKIKALRASLQDLLTKGVEPCPECGKYPLGIEQPYAYEVGCLSISCSSVYYKPKGRRAQGRSIDEAVANWNTKNYIQK